jgi:hypothetical protein
VEEERHRALSHLRRQGPYRNSTPPAVGANLQTLGHTPHHCLLFCHPFGSHDRFRLTQLVRVPTPLYAGAILGSLA